MNGWTALTYEAYGPIEVDPWLYLGDEAMVLWDRDVAPLLTLDVREFELRVEDADGPTVVIHGMTFSDQAGTRYSAHAVWVPDELRRKSTMLGWRPWWLRYSP